MRPIDADALYDKAEMWYKGAHTPFRRIYRRFVDAVADAPTIDQPQNDPLTLEELREMEGEPVWIERHDDGCQVGYAIVGSFISPYGVYFGTARGGLRLPYDEYGKTWFARRLKPED